MEEYPPFSVTGGGSDPSPDVDKSTQKPVDPSSMSFVYSWMFSVIASVLSFNTINDKDKQIENSDNKENIKPIDQTLNNNNNLINYSIFNQTNKRFYNIFSTKKPIETTSDATNNNINSDEAIQTQLQQQTKSSDLLSIFNHNLILPPCKKTLILDLDETLIHSTLVPVNHHHLTVNVVVEDVECTFYVIKRPHVDYFIEKVAEWYDVVVFTASMKEYADPLLNKLDKNKLMKKRYFRESCLEKEGNYVKDLSLIQQDLATTIIIDNSPIAYSNNVENALPIDNWMGDNPSDQSLLTLLPFLEVLRYVNDVRSILSLRFSQ